MKRIAIKIDADTYLGTLSGVPAIQEILGRHHASGTFYFSLGPDHSGRESRASSLGRFYGLTTRLYGRLLPGPDIGTRCAETLRNASLAGFEVGIHGWNRASWEKKVQHADNSWVETEMQKACARFADIFSNTAKTHGAAGWQMNRHALRLTQRFGFAFASDCRGNHPFIPVIDGEIVACPQLPTTLPTLDEILCLAPELSADQAVARIVQLSSSIPGDHVFTARAELEGMQFAGAFDRLISEWKSAGFQLVALCDYFSTLDTTALPLHSIHFQETPGRNGARMTQGPTFP